MKQSLIFLLVFSLSFPTFAQSNPQQYDTLTQRIRSENIEEKNLDALYMESLFKTEVLLAIQRSEYINQQLGLNRESSKFVILSTAAIEASLAVLGTRGSIFLINHITPSASKALWKQKYTSLKRDALAKAEALRAIESQRSPISASFGRDPFFPLTDETLSFVVPAVEAPRAPSSVTLTEAIDLNNSPIASQIDDIAAATKATHAAEIQELTQTNIALKQQVERLETIATVTSAEKDASLRLLKAQNAYIEANKALQSHLATEPRALYSLARGLRHVGKLTVVIAGTAVVVWAIGNAVMLQVPEATENLKAQLLQDIQQINATLKQHDHILQNAIQRATY